MRRLGIPLFLLAVLLATTADLGYAEEEEKDPAFSFGFRAGYYKPSLRTLNRVIADPSTSILQDPNFLLPRNPVFQASDRSLSTPGVPGDVNYGVDLGYRINEKISLVLSLMVFQSVTTASDEASLLLRQDLPLLRPPREARYNVNINQYFLSWRYHFYNQPRRRTFYFDVGLFGLAEADLTMDALMKVVDPNAPGGGFTSVSSTEASGLGFVIHFGIGGEWYLTRWLSVGFNAEYVLGTIDKLKVERVFTAGFPFIPTPPPESLVQTPAVIPTPQNPPVVGESVTYATVTNVTPTREVWPLPTPELPLELDGFDLTAQIRFHF